VASILNPHILIVDTDASAARITRAGVERMAPDVTIAVEADAEGARRSLYHHPPDILIIDPPRHSLAGMHLIRDLKAAFPAVGVIVLASAPSPTLRREMLLLGVDVYLEKPALLAHLVDAVRATLQLPLDLRPAP
jgi:DNA-binding response OmpR family regulator